MLATRMVAVGMRKEYLSTLVDAQGYSAAGLNEQEVVTYRAGHFNNCYIIETASTITYDATVRPF